MKKEKTVWISLSLAFLTVMILLASGIIKDGKEIQNGVLRFHVVANSDSAEDQANKLKVRDGISQLTGQLFADVQTKQQAVEIASENTELIARRAQQVLQQNGVDQTVNVSVRQKFFPTKQYGGISLPAGTYDAICIDIGKASGQNFWCVMFPSLCVTPAIAKEEQQNIALMDEVLSEQAMDVVTKPYSFKFKFIEWYDSVINFFTK